MSYTLGDPGQLVAGRCNIFGRKFTSLHEALRNVSKKLAEKNNMQKLATMDPSPKTIELRSITRSNEIRGSRELRDNWFTQEIIKVVYMKSGRALLLLI